MNRGVAAIVALQLRLNTRGMETEAANSNLFDVPGVARLLGVSESWVRRHAMELPTVRVGRLIRFDAALILRKFSGRITAGKPLDEASTERTRMIQRNQKGFVYKRGASKVWYGRYRDDVLARNGAILPRADAVILLQRRMASQKPRTTMTLTELHQRWEAAEVPTIKPTTANYYQKILRAHILPVFGEREVVRIQREDVQLFLAEQAPKYSKNTLRGMRVSMSRVLTWATENGWLEKNPCSKVRLPDCGKEERAYKPLKAEEIIALAGKLDEPFSTLVLFLAVTGLRIGEAIGIKWSDFEGDVFTVSRTIYEGKAQSPKSKKSLRPLPIPAELLKRMQALGGSEFVFRSRAGTPLNPGNCS
jgi:Phage integrase, N-terminal SAM-like domain